MMNTAALKKASYASRQMRGGPAPLASFEDLPSDEMESPSSITGNTTSDSESLNDKQNDSSTPGTVLCSPVSALHISVQDQSDALSQNTLTPCLSMDGYDVPHPVTPVTQVEDPAVLLGDSSSAVFLSVEQEKSPVESRRKGSWTDLFHRPRSRSRSRSPQSSPQPPRKVNDQDKSEQSADDGSKKKKGILSSLFKFHDKKSSKGTKPELSVKSPAEAVDTQSSSTPTFENEVRAQEKVFTLGSPPPPPCHQFQVSIAVSAEAEDIPTKLQSLSLSLTDIPCKICNEKNDDDNNSSESELVTEVHVEKEEVDFEAETLLAQDSVDYDDFAALEGASEFVPIGSQMHQQQKPRRQRLEITTVPIDRPRSTTPISVAPLEAFIQSSLHSPSPDVEKLKVLLPTEAFLSRPKSPKKSHPKSWQDFCQSGLHSPRLPKRNDDEHTPDEESHRKDSWTPSKECWETFEGSRDTVSGSTEAKLSTSSSFSSSCDSNSTGLNKETKFTESFSSLNSNEKLYLCSNTNFSPNEELSRLNDC